MDVSVLHTHDELEALLPDWTGLYEASASRNPFADPRWLAVWARHYARGSRLETIVVRDRGELVGVAPFYHGPGRLDRWRLLGSVDRRQLNELPQLLVRADCTPRRAARRSSTSSSVAATSSTGSNFMLAPEQGWTQPEWFDLEGSSCFSVHRGTRPCVVLPLPGELGRAARPA